jgi:6,7-dimethyl-8-ribityllumazine synthase
MKKTIGIIVATYYPNISDMLLKGAYNELTKNLSSIGYLYEYGKPITVPGIFEIPVIISKNINEFDAFIALGCVIKGETPHFGLISKTVVKAIMELSIKYKKPIGNGIITCLNEKQALERANVNKKDKGGEAVKAVLSVLGNFKNEE